MAKLRVNALGDDTELFIEDLFTYVVDGGLEELIAQSLSNKNRIVSLFHWDEKDKELTFEITKLHQFDPYASLGQVADPINVGAGIEGSHLILDLNYQGGHKEHIIELTWDGTYSESSPPHVNLMMRHSADGDSCKAEINKKRAYTLSDLRPCVINIFLAGEHIHALEYGV